VAGLLNLVAYGIVGLLAVFTLWGIIPFAFLAFFTFKGAEQRADQALGQLTTTLMPDEILEAQALQSRVFALWQRRVAIGITNSRVLIIRRGLIGGFKMSDIQWKDLADVTLEQNVLPDLCGSNLNFKHFNAGAGLIQVQGIASDVASTIYSNSQAQEQAWEEKRRVRRMEEVRAAAGGVTVNNAHPATQAAAKAGTGSMIEEITKAKALLDTGVISDAEFNEMKAKILAAA
jgi:hypothetical protein